MTTATGNRYIRADERSWIVQVLSDRRWLPMLLVTPVLVFFLIWNTIPLLWLLGLSFHRYQLMMGGDPRFVGIENFVRIFNDPGLWADLGRTFVFVFVSVGLQTVLGVLLGLLFWGSTRMPGRRIALTLLFTPMLLTPAATGTFFRLIYEPTFGVLNAILRGLGFQAVDFLGSAAIAFPAVLAVDVWMWTPFMVLMTLAALGSVPKAELEAAEVDRLPWSQRLRLIVFHHGKFILLLGILLRTIEGFKTMDLVFQMTDGGPGSSTRLVAISLYRLGFDSFAMGRASALAVLLLLISIAFTAMFIYVLHLREKRRRI